MQILRILGLAGIALSAYAQAVSRPEVVEVRRVADGNTIDVAGRGRIRLAGIHAPKVDRDGVGELFGRDARERLEGILMHRFVRLEFPSPGLRSSAYVLLEDGTFVNALLAREGLARVSGPGPRADELRRAEIEAKSARRGIWRDGR
jgi:micrococcal nuclease